MRISTRVVGAVMIAALLGFIAGRIRTTGSAGGDSPATLTPRSATVAPSASARATLAPAAQPALRIPLPEGRLLVQNGYASDLVGADRRILLGPLDAQDISPDGSRVLATAGHGQLLIIDAATQARAVLVRADRNEILKRAKWAPDGSRVAYAVDTYAKVVGPPPLGEPVLMTVCILQLPTHENRCYPQVDRLNEFNWSPDGMRLVVDILGSPRVDVLDTGTGEVLGLLPVGGSESVRVALQSAGFGPPEQFILSSWSPSGRYLATLTFVEGPAHVVVLVVRADGTFVAMGQASGEFTSALGWSPVRDFFAYTRGEAPYRITEAILLDPLRDVDSLLVSAEGQGYPIIQGMAWSPSGRWVALARWGTDSAKALQIVDVTGAEPPVDFSLPWAGSDPLRDWGP